MALTACVLGMGLWLLYEVWHWRTRIRRREEPAEPGPFLDSRPVSFLVAAWNAAEDIGPFLEAYAALDLPAKELVLCAGGTDGTWEAAVSAPSGPDVVVIRQEPGDGKQGALARCWGHARGEIIYLTDIDCRPTTRGVARMLTVLRTDRASAVSGGVIPLARDLRHPLVRVRAAIDAYVEAGSVRPIKGLRGCNAALTRAALDSVGGFRVEAPSGTDYTLAQELRARGHTILHVPGAAMATRYPATVRGYVRQQRRWLRNVFRLGRRYHVREDVLLTTRTLMLPYVVIALGVLAVVWTPLWWFGVGALVGHGVGNRLGYQKQMGMDPTVSGAVASVAADLLASLEASFDLAAGRTAW